jgi:N-dimethylarginine dimethylaminohydrolase
MSTEGVTGSGIAGETAPPRFGVRSMSSPLRRVLLRRPSVTGDFAAAAWRAPDAGLLARQHEAFGQLLTDLGCEVDVAPAADGLVDATYVRDPGLVTGAGAVLFQMAKPARAAEPALLGTALSAAGVPVAARLAGAARADGGDFIWLDEHTMLAGRSYRTNAEGLRQLAQVLAAEGASLESVDLPHDRGPGHVLHLMSLISPVADDLAVVYPPLAPVARRAGDPGGPGRRRRVRDDGVQRPGCGAAAGGRGERQPADPCRARVGRLRGARLRRLGDLPQGRRGPHLPDRTGLARRRRLAAWAASSF